MVTLGLTTRKSQISQVDIVYICVADAPVLAFGPYDTLRVIRGTDVTLECVVDANPLVAADSVQWKLRNQVIGE